MIVHLFEDEKFVDTSIQKFEEVACNKNKYIVFSDTKKLKHPKKLDKIIILPNKWYKLNLGKVFNNCDLLVVHYLSPIKLYIIKHKPDNIKVLWIVWGKDVYPFFKNFILYEPLTKNIVNSQLKEKLKKTIIYDLYHLISYGVRGLNKETKTLSEIKYLSTVLPFEFEQIKKEFTLNSIYIPFNYDSFNKLFSKNVDYKLGKNILIGNSATHSNNHLDIFKIIKDFRFLIIVPLSYGNKKYRKIIINEGERKYGEKFKPLVEFLPLKEYQEIILSCNTMVMHHLRQQALGNILVALFVGIRVYLNPRSLTYKYLKSIGLIICTLEKEYDLLGEELNSIEKKVNRDVILAFWSEENILKGTANIVNLNRKN